MKVLEFKKGDSVVAIGANILIVTRLIDTKLCKVFVELDGTLVDASDKVNRLCSLSNDIFEEFDRIRKESL